jgi:Tol biopolymer transport system component
MPLRCTVLAFAASAALLATACKQEADSPSADASTTDASVADAGADATPGDAEVADAPVADAPVADAAAEADAEAPLVDAAPPADATPLLPDGDFPDGGPLGGFVIANAQRHTSPSSAFYWLVRIPLDGGAAVNLTPQTGPGVSSFAVTPDGQHAVYETYWGAGGVHPGLFVVRTDGTGAPVDLVGTLPDDAVVNDLQLSPRGDRVAFRSQPDGHLWTVGLAGEGLVAVSGAHVASEYAWSPRGDRLLYLSENASGQELTFTCADHDCSHSPLPGKRVAQPSFSPDGAHVRMSIDLGNGSPPGLWVLDVASETSHRLAISFLGAQDAMKWSPDGQQLAFLVGTSDAGSVHVACVDGSCDHVMPLPADLDLRTDDGFGFSPDGRYLLVVAENAHLTPYRLFTVCTDGSCVHEHTPTGDAFHMHASWTPEGRIIHRGQLPGSTLVRAVADCALGDCPRVSVFGDADLVDQVSTWFAGSTRFVSDSGDGLFVCEGVGQPARRLHPGFHSFPIFDASGQRVIFGTLDGLFSIRIDGTDLRRLDDSLSPAGRVFGPDLVVLQ